jgi:hypothetical protein
LRPLHCVRSLTRFYYCDEQTRLLGDALEGLVRVHQRVIGAKACLLRGALQFRYPVDVAFLIWHNHCLLFFYTHPGGEGAIYLGHPFVKDE